jgi:coenzyme F420 biosynthesis associated uncharacterized protein
VPLLRELHRLLSSSEPVNWELARQVAVALACHDEPAIPDQAAIQRDLETLSRAAEVQAQEFTGLVAGQPASVSVVSRAEWIESNIAWFRVLMDPLARKMTGGGAGDAAAAALGQVGAVLIGLQAGFVLGYLARHVLGQYELALPQPSEPRLLYVLTNLRELETEWELDSRDFRYWIALHETTHHLEMTRPWARAWFRAQLNAFIDSLDFDPARIQSSLGELGVLDPQKMAEALQDPERLIQATWTPAGVDVLTRLQAFMTLAEGYSTFVMDAVGASVLKDLPRLQEVMRRRRLSASPGEALLERMLGLELKRKQYDDGVKFCRYVASLRDVESLNRAWDSPESLPTADEIADPDAWVARVLDS